jgi:hypothetical protein
MLKRLKLTLFLSLFLILNKNTTIAQITAEDNNSNNVYSIVEFSEVLTVMDSCVSQGGIGSALNFLSARSWNLIGGGKNLSKGDSLVFTLDAFFKNNNRYYAWAIDNHHDVNYYLPDHADITHTGFQSEFMIRFQFSNKKDVETLVTKLVALKYKKIAEEVNGDFQKYTYRNNKYTVILRELISETEEVYMYDIFNNLN